MKPNITTAINTNTVAKCITKHRLIQQKTQADIANELNVSFQAVSKWERGICIPDLQKLVMLADIFQISLDEFFGRHVDNSEYNDENTAFKTAKHLIEARCNFDDISRLLNHLSNSQILQLGYIALKSKYKISEIRLLTDRLSNQERTEFAISAIQHKYSAKDILPLLDTLDSRQRCDVINTFTEYHHSFLGLENIIAELDEPHKNEAVRVALYNGCRLCDVGELINKITFGKD